MILTTLLLSSFAWLPAIPQDPAPQPDPAPEQDPVEQEPEQEPEAEPEVEEDPEEETEEEPEIVDTSPYLAVVGATVHTVSDGDIANATVLCKNRRILKVGRNVAIPDGAQIINATGMHVYPGLIAVNSSGIVSGRGKSLRDSYDPYSLNVGLGLAGGLTTVYSGGAIAKLVWDSLDDVLIAQTSWVTVNWSSSNPGNRRKVLAGLRGAQDFLREMRYFEAAKAAGEEDLEEPSDKGVDKDYLALLEHQKTARFNANTVSDLRSLCDLLQDFPMRAVVFGGREAWTLASELGRAGVSMVLTPRNKSWADPDLNRDSGWSIENAAKLWEHGVEFALVPGQTYISTGGIAGRDLLTLPMEAAFAIRGGLSEEAALRSITIDAARILGVGERIGSIEPGKDADLIVTDYELFDYRSFVQWAVVNGRQVYDKQTAPYFAHIRPRPEPEAVVAAVIAAIENADEIGKDSAADDENDAAEHSDSPDAPVDSPK